MHQQQMADIVSQDNSIAKHRFVMVEDSTVHNVTVEDATVHNVTVEDDTAAVNFIRCESSSHFHSSDNFIERSESDSKFIITTSLL